MMNKYILIPTVIAGILLIVTLGHFVYMKSISYECQTELPATIFVSEEPVNQIMSTKCKGGIFAKFPIN